MNEEFDQGRLNALLEKDDYTEAANYLKSFRNTVADDKLMEFDSDVLNLTRKGRIRDAKLNRLSNMPKHSKELFLFNEAITNGDALPEDNRYTRQHNDYLKDLYSDRHIEYSTASYANHGTTQWDNPNANNNINVRFDSEEKYQNFLKNAIDGREDILLASGITREYQEDGTVRMVFNPSNPNLKNIITGLDKGRGLFDDDFDLMHDDWKKVIKSNFESSIKSLNNLYNTTEQVSNELTNANLNMPVTSTVTGYMGARHAKLVQGLANGSISTAMYEKLLSTCKDEYDRLITMHSYASTPMYMYTDTEQGEVLGEVTSSKERVKLGERIAAAMQQKRLEYASGEVGGMYGTFITIVPYVKNGDIEIKDYDSDDPSLTRGYRLFIPGLLEDEAETALTIDTKTRAQSEISLMSAYGYDYPLTQGGDVRATGDGTFGFINPETNEFEEKDRKDISEMLNLSMILDDGITAVNKYVYDNDIDVDAIKQQSSTEDLPQEAKTVISKVSAMASAAAQDVLGVNEGLPYERMRYYIYSFILNHTGFTSIANDNNIKENSYGY